MATHFYNTLTRQKEEFHPIEPGIIKLYTCGPTVYNFAHIGNFRAYIFEDLLKRYLKYKGYCVIQVMNITDVDDKIIRDANKESLSIDKFTRPYRDAFFADLDALRIERAEHYPAATEHIPEMVKLVKTLVDKGMAYKTDDGSIYFKVSEFPRYGQLANLNIASMIRGSRVINDEYEKEQIRDFALWKGWKSEDGDVFWETELGKGRPGWHIECSAMSMKYLGHHFDIHCGGVDNIFPHHENEIAQSESATGEKFVNYWLHCEHLLVNGEKMSKSLGNFIYLRELLDKGTDPSAIRFTLLSTHYRQKLNFTDEKLGASAKSITRLRDFYKSLEESLVNSKPELSGLVDDARKDFESSLDDDLNISEALASVFSLIREVNVFRQTHNLTKLDAENIQQFLNDANTILDILSTSEYELTEEEKNLIESRNVARENRNWSEADRIRDILLGKGIVLEDSPKGTTWKRKIST
ncbi:MAG: cysteine--tRNA ligase [Candidatus Neomarinimicrobiota bacterium]|nr:MAG: cysteine--tRNA ligase [Candidatus Neomarinimicrobiota bacterium]